MSGVQIPYHPPSLPAAFRGIPEFRGPSARIHGANDATERGGDGRPITASSDAGWPMFLRLVIPRDLRPCWSLTGQGPPAAPSGVSAGPCPVCGLCFWNGLSHDRVASRDPPHAFQNVPQAGISRARLGRPPCRTVRIRSAGPIQGRKPGAPVIFQCDHFWLVKQLVRQSVGSTEQSRCRDGSRPACSRNGFRRCWPTWRQSGKAQAASAKRGACMQMIDLMVSPSHSDGSPTATCLPTRRPGEAGRQGLQDRAGGAVGCIA